MQQEHGNSAGLVVFAHGSSVPEANESVRAVADATAKSCKFPMWEAAFLELVQPDLPGAIHSLAARGAKKIVVAPYFLMMGVHLQRDLPRILEDVSRAHPDVDIVCTTPLDGHPLLVDILSARIQQTLDNK